ncbi:MAG: hypothetical protein IT210_14120 [Armatimonadetes bacterium]|nr:hypothetical protein [Armatimonadota bacterium]
MRYPFHRAALLLALLLAGGAAVQAADNLLPDPSIEQARPKTQFGIPYAQWGGWIFEGACEFRNGKVSRTGSASAEIVGGQSGKIRLYTPAVTVEPGRYRFSCYIRGLDIGPGAWGTCEDVNFVDEQHHPVKKMGTFGWTRLEIVKDVPARQEIVARMGLWGPGRLWVDDAEIVRVPADTPLTDGPALGEEEKPIAPPEPLDNARAVRCPDCGYRNLAVWQKCYACGESLTAQAQTAGGPDVRTLHSFEEGGIQPFAADAPENASITGEYATDGKSSLRLKKGYVSWDGPQDWTGYDFFKADAFNSTGKPVQLYFEVQDKTTTDYWTRVNYTTVIPPGKSVLIIPTDLYVGEKSRPGRPLDLANIKRVVLSIGENKGGAVDFDRLRLERDLSDSVKVPGLMAFSFGPGTSRPLRGFTQVTPATQYSPGRGYGLKDAQIFRAYDALQPDPLYQTGIIIQNGGFAIDLPDGKYHVFVNLDSPSGFWGEYQVYRERVVKANGVEVAHDRMDLPAFLKKYYRFADVEDSPEENTFDKYQKIYFQEKEFDVEVKGGRLFLEFIGEAWANYVSALVVYPAEQAEAGRKYLENLSQRRRFYFDNYFKRILPDGMRDAKGAIPPFKPTAGEQSRGYVLFARDWMDDVPVNAAPRREEVTRKLAIFASAGQKEPVVFSIHTLKNLGPVRVSATGLVSPSGRIPASAIQAGVVSHRLSRVTMEGTVYTISPRLIMPRSGASLRKGVSTTFWLTLNAPDRVKPGVYRGRLLLAFADGKKDAIELTARLFAEKLDELDIPAGPWGSAMPLPWYEEDTGGFNRQIYRKSLAQMRSYGCTTFSGIPTLRIRGWQNGRPDIDFTQADQEMADARAAGFKQIVVNYNGGILGFNNYFIDEAAMQSAGFAKYTDFLRAALTEVDAHARSAGWLPVAYNLCDEPLKEDVPRAAANAQAWREAAPLALYTTGATSMENPRPDDPHLPLARALKIANLNLHDDKAIRLIHKAGSDWAFYNGGNRWTFGTYMYKCAKDYNMKFRISWHWNACAGDPYYALDCREDDYAWCVTNARMEMIPSIHFERDIRAGIQDYRYMLTLSRLLAKRPNHPAASAARKLLKDKLASFKLGERDHDAKWPMKEYHIYRLSLAQAIEKLSR